MPTKKAKKATVKVDNKTINPGDTGFIVLSDLGYGGKTKYELSGSDLHKTIDKAKACCGDNGDAILEVTVVGFWKNTPAYVKSEKIDLKFND